MRGLRWGALVAGTPLLAAAVANMDSAVRRETGPPPDPDAFTYATYETVEYDLLVPLAGLAGLSLIGVAILWRPGRTPDGSARD